MKGPDAIYAGIGFGWEGERYVCWKPGCGSTLTAKQANGRWACPWHFDSPVQLEIPATPQERTTP